MAIIQIASIRVLTSGLGVNHYAIFALLTALTGWFMLADGGLGASLQNYISEQRAKDCAYESYVKSASAVAGIMLLFAIVVLYVLSPLISSIYLERFSSVGSASKEHMLLFSGIILLCSSFGGIIYKIWYAEQKGYFSNIVPAIASFIGYLAIVVVNNSHANDRLMLSLIAFLFPPAMLPSVALIIRNAIAIKSEKLKISTDITVKVVKRAVHFWFFGLMAALVLQVDYIIMSQFISSYDIVLYTISIKTFGILLMVYGSLLSALWPVFSEAIALGQWSKVYVYTRKYLGIGLLFIAISTFCLLWTMPLVVSIVVPRGRIIVPTGVIILFGVYCMLRVWTDTFAMILQSMSEFKSLWIFVPIQAVVTITIQWSCAPIFGLYGILFGLIGSFILTVAWALPLAVRNKFSASQVDI